MPLRVKRRKQQKGGYFNRFLKVPAISFSCFLSTFHDEFRFCVKKLDANVITHISKADYIGKLIFRLISANGVKQIRPASFRLQCFKHIRIVFLFLLELIRLAAFWEKFEYKWLKNEMKFSINSKLAPCFSIIILFSIKSF